MKKNLILAVATVSSLVLTTASCNKKLGEFQQDYFSTNPDPLELVGNKVPAMVTARIPAKFFVTDAVVRVTPTLMYNNTQATSQSYTFQGDKVKGNATTVSYEYGGTYNIPVSFDYVSAMDKSELYLDFDVTQGNKQYMLPRVKVADGVISTAAFATPVTVTPEIAPDAYTKEITDTTKADIMFLINMANIRADQLKTDAMVELQNQLVSANGDSRRKIEEINIKSYASPDGPYAFNQQLAKHREDNTVDYITGQLKKDNISEFGELTANFTAEDWEGFKELVSKSDIQDKQLILSILEMYKDPEVRDAEIRNLGNVFNELAETILPKLRYSRISAIVKVTGKTPEEMNDAYFTNPGDLTVEEILYYATLTDDNKRRQEIYATATQLYPQDYRTWNDLGMMQYINGDYKGAKDSFTKAASLANGKPEPQMNLGLIEMVNGNYENANRYFGAAGQAENIGEALGVYYLKTGDNAQAARSMANTKSNNAALAQILTKDYNKAKSTLAGINKPDATTYYLMAVLGARTNNEQMINTNLKQAIKLDNSLVLKAMKDMEFQNYDLSKVLNQ